MGELSKRSSLSFRVPLVQTSCLSFSLSSVASWSWKENLRGYSHFTSQKNWRQEEETDSPRQNLHWTWAVFPPWHRDWENYAEILNLKHSGSTGDADVKRGFLGFLAVDLEKGGIDETKMIESEKSKKDLSTTWRWFTVESWPFSVLHCDYFLMHLI